MPETVRFSEGRTAVTTLKAAEGPVRLHLLPDPSARLEGAQVLKRNLYRAAGRVEVPGIGPLLLKVHRPRGFVDSLRATLRPSRAREEWRAARYLRGAGLPTPEPVLLAERRHGPLLSQAATAVRFLSHRETLEPALLAQPPAMARALLARVARWVRAMHDRGASHGDLHSGNLLAGPGPGDRCDLHVVDLHRVRVGAALSRAARERNLVQWLHSLRAAVARGGRLRALLAYSGERPARRRLRALLARGEGGVRRRERRRLRSRSRRCVQESTRFTRDLGLGGGAGNGAGRGFRLRDLPPARIERALAEHDRALALSCEDARAPADGHALPPAPGGSARLARVLKRGPRSRVTRHGDLVVKEAVRPGSKGRLEAILLPRRLSRGYRNAHGLAVRGVGTAAPLAFVRRDGRAFTLYEDLSALPRLDHRVRAALSAREERAREWTRRRRLEVLDATAGFAAGLHRAGIWHGDWKGCNWLVEERGRAFSIRLVDTDRVRFLRRVSWARRMRNLAQLAASIPVCVTRADRLRWFRRYALASRLLPRGATAAERRETERRAARDVAARLARKTVVVDEPIE